MRKLYVSFSVYKSFSLFTHHTHTHIYIYISQIKDYTDVIRLDPKNCHAYHNRGISYDKKGDFEKAIADFTKVLKLDKNNAHAYFNRGSTHDSLGAYDKAIVDYTRALDLDRSTNSSSSVSNN